MRGKADEAFYQTDDIWDHPRLCGEKVNSVNYENGHKGSPPPMRGKAKWILQSYQQPGITPAYAGKSR